MEKTNFLLSITKREKQALEEVAKQFGFSLSEYMRKKLFNENTDLLDENKRYISASTDKHNIISLTILYKLFYTQQEILSKLNFDKEEIEEIEQESLQFARKTREKHGYKIIEKSHEQ